MNSFIFHHIDLDGFVSREIVRKFITERTGRDPICMEINYGMEFDDSLINYEEDDVFVVDFCLQPQEKMVKAIKDLQGRLTWIDHHKTSVELIKNNPELKFKGKVKSDKKAACEMCWNFFFPKEKIPKQVEMISQYDVWNKEGKYDWAEEIVPFKMWAESNTIDQDFLRNFTDEKFESAIRTGKQIETYLNKIDQSITIENSFEVKIRSNIPVVDDLLSAIVLNSSKKGSRQFTSAFDEDKFDLMIAYANVKGKYWTLGIYSVKENVDCSKIAQELGALGPFGPGGGHKGAAGCQLDTKTLLEFLGI